MTYRKLGFLYPLDQYQDLWQKGFFDLEPQRRLPQAIVLDIDETLVWTTTLTKAPSNLHPDYAQRNYTLRFDHPDMWGVVRPHCRAFLDYCLRTFEYTFIWTAGHELYANSIVDHLFPAGTPQPTAVYNRNHCEGKRDMYYKPLDRIAKDWNIPKESILMIDNNDKVIIEADQPNLVNIPDYLPKLGISDTDKHLLVLMQWLQSRPFVQGNVTTCDLRHIF